MGPTNHFYRFSLMIQNVRNNDRAGYELISGGSKQ